MEENTMQMGQDPAAGVPAEGEGTAAAKAAEQAAASSGAAQDQEKPDDGQQETLTAEEISQIMKTDAELKAREANIRVGELKIKAHGVLAEKGLDPGLLDILVYTDEESCNKSISAIEAAVKAATEKAVNARLGGSVPKSPTGIPSAPVNLNGALTAHYKKMNIGV